MLLTTFLAAAALLQRTDATPQQQEQPTTGLSVPYAAVELQADCIAAMSGDPVGRRLCHATLHEQIERLFPRDNNNAADGCLVVPMLPLGKVLGAATVAIAEAKSPPASSADDFAAATLLTLYPCGLRRR